MCKNITIEGINKEFSSFGGLKFYDSLYNQLGISSKIKEILSSSKHSNAISNQHKFKSLVYSSICGGDCLDDLLWQKKDEIFRYLTDGAIAPTTAGEFLRSVTKQQIASLEDMHMDLALKLRLAMFPEDKYFELTMDAAPHDQHSLKKEGCEFDYRKSSRCLSSQNCFDQYGFSYAFKLREGNAHSRKGAELLIRSILKRVPEGIKRFFRADSAYGVLSIFNELINANAKFTIVLKSNVYKSILEKNRNTMKWRKTRMKFFDSDSCEISSALYPLKGIAGGLSHLRVVFVRAPKMIEECEEIEDVIDGYRYYAIATNIFQHEAADAPLQAKQP